MIDLLHTQDGDIDLSTGDLQMAETDQATGQHKRDILLASPGDYKDDPPLGVAVVDYINSESSSLFLREVSKQMTRDGIKVRRVAFSSEGKVVIEGGYENS